MKHLFGIVLLLSLSAQLFAQEEVSVEINFPFRADGEEDELENEVLQIPVADSILNPLIMVIHSMGDINIKGHEGQDLFVYAQDLLPSVTELIDPKQTQVFTFIDKNTRRKVTVNQTNTFSVQQMGNLFQIETNMFTFSNHVFVMAPERSSVAVLSTDFGNIVVEDIEGEVDAEANAGNILLKNIGGTVNATTVHGNVIADQSEQESVEPLFISTFIGNIEIIVPQGAENTALLSSEMGNLYSNFNTVNTINVTSSRNVAKNRTLSFDLNGGGTEFVLNTYKGDIYLRYHEQ